MAELKQQGLVRHIGVSNFDVDQLRRIAQIAPVETLQPQYSLVEREIEGAVLPFAEREQIGLIVYSPMGSGMLSGGMTRERVERLPEDDWCKHDTAIQRAAAVAEPRPGRPPDDPILTGGNLELTNGDIAEIEGSTP